MALTKKIIGSVAAIALVLTTVLTFAFTESKTEKKRVPQTWYYQLTSTSLTDINNPSNYLTTPLPEAECGSGTVVCSIFDEPNATNTHPAFSQGNVSDHIVGYSTEFKEAE